MNVHELMNNLEELGVQLWTDGGALRFRAPRGVMTEDRREALKSHRTEIIDYLQRGKADTRISPDPTKAHEPFPLTPVQSAYLVGRSGAYDFGGISCTSYLEILFPDTDPSTIESAWNAFVQRHDMLRATVNSNGYQVIHSEVPHYGIPVYDVRESSQSEEQAQIESHRDDLLSRTTSTETWPLFALCIARTDEGCLLHLLVELLILDAAGVQSLLLELDELVQGEPVKPRPRIGFRDYVLGQRRLRNGPAYHRDRDYWLGRLEGLPPAPELPSSAGGEADAAVFERFTAHLSAAELNRLSRHAREQGLTVSGVLLAAYAETIGRWSRNRNFTLNLPVFNRMPCHPDIDAVLGDFTSVILLETDLDAQDAFVDRARALTAQLFADLDHRLFDGVEVLGELTRRNGGPVLMPVVYTSTIGMSGETGAGRTRKGRILRGMTRTPQVWLDCQVAEHEGGLLLAWDVRRGVLPGHAAEDAFQAFADLVARLAGGPEAWSRRHPIVLPDAQRERRRAYNDTTVPRRPRLLHEPIIRRAEDYPDDPAVIDDRGALTFGELAGKAAAVAAALEEFGVEAGERVAVVMEKGREQMAAVLGALAVGGAYVPVEPSQPRARRDAILQASKARIVLTQSWTSQKAHWPASVHAVPVDRLSSVGASIRADAVSPNQPAYVIYTSGTTGDPKGVVVTHQAAANTIDDVNRRFALSRDDRVLATADLSFDLSVWDVFGVLAAGGTLVLPKPTSTPDPSHWARLIEEHSVTVWNSVPAQLQMLWDYLESSHELEGPATMPVATLRLALLSGDWIPLDLPGRIHAAQPNVQVISLGGATEASIWSIWYPIGEVDPTWRSIPYGAPLENQEVHVLDRALQTCPEYVPGDIHIGGAGLAEGYLDDDERTAEKFIVHPETGARLYRTGDLGRFHPQGWIEFLGREDTQVKIRGHRVELGEIESALRRHSAVADATALLRDPAPEDAARHGGAGTGVAAFVELAVDSSGDGDERSTTVLSAAERSARESNDGLDDASFLQLMHAVDEMAVRSIAVQLRASGLFADSHEEHSLSEIAAATGVSDRQSGLLHRWLNALVHYGAIKRSPTGDSYYDLIEADRGSVERSWEEIDGLERAVGYGRETLDYIRTCSTRLDELLRGDLDVRDLLFPDGKVGAASAVYRDNLVGRAMHRIVVAAIRAVARQTPGRLRVLEVGAGIGGTSSELIPALAEFEPDYCFTDLSEFFLGEARTAFADFPWVRFNRFDINEDIRPQGQLPNSFDVILCANVLHNSRNAGEVLAGLRELLAPGGWLVFLEPTRQHNYALLVSMEFEFFSELAAFTDLRAGTGQAFFTRTQWLDLLDEAGADCARVLPDEHDAIAAAGQGVFIARFNGARRRTTAEDLIQHTARLLPRHMVPDEVQLLDALPRTQNGKPDRSTLRSWLLRRETIDVSPDTPPVDDLEQRIAALWGEMLGVGPVGRNQDFYFLGGDSLLLSRMIGRLREREPSAAEREWQDLLRYMLRDATVAGLAAQLRAPSPAEHADAGSGSLLRLGGEAAECTWVLVHGGTGTLEPYQSLLPHLRSAHAGAIVGLQVADLDHYLTLPPEAVITGLARDYAAELLESGDRFRIVGYCVGGLLAAEIARTLTEAGAAVDGLTVISSYQPPTVDDELMAEYIFAQAVGADLEAAGFPGDAVAFGKAVHAVLQNSPSRIPEGALVGLDEPFEDLAVRFDSLAAVPPEERIAKIHAASTGGGTYNSGGHSLEEFQRMFATFRQSMRAVAAHRAEPYLGAALLLRNSESSTLLPGTREDVGGFWSRICLGPFEIRDIPGDHFSCMSATNAAALGRLITRGHT